LFTGIITKTARVGRMARVESGAALSIESPWGNEAASTRPKPGESINVNGACLTVVSADERQISFDISEETLKKTTFSDLRSGARVNLERALRAGGDISGHFVQGHVDGVGKVEGLERSGEFAELRVRVPAELAAYVVEKGSIAIDGVSLTVAGMEGEVVSVALIPETLARTTLGGLSAGEGVNVETDIVGKYVVRYMQARGGGGLTMERLRDAGFE